MLRIAAPNTPLEVRTIATGGDLDVRAPVPQIGVGVFVKELEAALLRREIDLAVHSLKDLPSKISDGLSIGAVIRREDTRDALVNKWRLPSGGDAKGRSNRHGEPATVRPVACHPSGYSSPTHAGQRPQPPAKGIRRGIRRRGASNGGVCAGCKERMRLSRCSSRNSSCPLPARERWRYR